MQSGQFLEENSTSFQKNRKCVNKYYAVYSILSYDDFKGEMFKNNKHTLLGKINIENSLNVKKNFIVSLERFKEFLHKNNISKTFYFFFGNLAWIYLGSMFFENISSLHDNL